MKCICLKFLAKVMHYLKFSLLKWMPEGVLLFPLPLLRKDVCPHVLLRTQLTYLPWSQVSSFHLPSIFFIIIIPGFFLFLPSSSPTQPNHPLKSWLLFFSSFSKLALFPISLQKHFCMPYSSLETTGSPQLCNHSPTSTYPYRGLDHFLNCHMPFHNKIFLWRGQPRVPKSKCPQTSALN